MANLNQLELQNLRHLIGAHCTIEKKLEFYASQCTDPTFKDMLTKDTADANPEKHIEDWGLEDPTGKCDEEFINTSKIIESKIKDLAERIIIYKRPKKLTAPCLLYSGS